MIRSIFSLALIVAVASAFAPTFSTHVSTSTTARHMFFAEEDGKKEDTAKAASSPLEIVQEGESAASGVAPPQESAPKKMVVKNLAKGGEVREVDFFDPTLAANVGPMEMDWWAYPLVTVPFVLLANDFFHFLPKDGPLSEFLHY